MSDNMNDDEYHTARIFEALNNLQDMGLIKYQLHRYGANLSDASISVDVISDSFPIDFLSLAAN